MGNLIKNMKEAIAKSGSSKKEILYFPADSVHRVRFLIELEDGYQFQFHSDFNTNVNALCTDPEEHEDCPYCKDEIKLVDHFIWPVWDYDSNSVRLLNFKASGVSPVPAFIEMYEEFGTIMDRDYKIKKVGKGMGGSYVVTPMDKEKFTNKKAKVPNQKQIEQILLKAYNTDSDDKDSDEDVEDTKEAKKANASKGKKKKEKTLKSKFLDLDMDDLKEIAKELGMTKKGLRAFDDEEELVDELFDSYEEDDLEDMLNDLDNSDDDEDEDDD